MHEHDNREPCPHCGRKFLPERLVRHVKVCEDLKRGKEWRGAFQARGELTPNSATKPARMSLNKTAKW